MRKIFIFFALGFLLSLPGFIHAAQAVHDSEAVLEKYVEVALKNNPGLRASFERFRAEKRKAGSAGTLPDPEISYTNFIRSVETRVGPQEHRLGLRQSFPWFGTLSSESKFAERNADVRGFEFEHERLSLIRDVKHLFYEAYYLEKSLEILQQNVDLMNRLERVTRSQYRTGIGNFSDVIRSQVERDKITDRLASKKDLKGPFAVKFNTLLNRDPDETIDWPASIPSSTFASNMESLRKKAEAMNPLVLVLRKEAEREGERVRIESKKGLPSFKLGVDYIFTGEAIAPTPSSGKDPILAMISMNVPLWRGKYNDQMVEAKRRKSAAQNAEREKINQVYADLAQANFEVSDAIRKIKLYEKDLIPKAKQSFSATKRSYEAGKASFSDLIDAERLWLEFQLAFEEARVRAKKAEATIELLIGGPIDQMEKNQ